MHSTHFWCDGCEGHAELMIVGTTGYTDEDNDQHNVILGRCVKCGRPGVVEGRASQRNLLDRTQLYPKIIRKSDVDRVALPSRVGESFREAALCEGVGAWLATAVMVRRTLEAIAKEFDASVKTLVAGLDTLRTNGLISEELHQWGTELRFIGNIGAHATDDVITRQDAQDAMEFLRAIVETIYLLRPKFQEMQLRRKKAKEPPVK